MLVRCTASGSLVLVGIRGLPAVVVRRYPGGVGFVGELNKVPTRKCITDSLTMLCRMEHRGACGCEANTGRCAVCMLAARPLSTGMRAKHGRARTWLRSNTRA
jgi:hypothetical protein